MVIKPKRKSLQPYNRGNPYDDRRGSSNDHVQLPDIYGNVNGSALGRPYPFTNATEQNNVMITKLLNRKKSYERMMRVEDGNGGSQSVLQGNIR